MKRTYEKPVLVKAGELAKVAAVCPSGYFLENGSCVPEKTTPI